MTLEKRLPKQRDRVDVSGEQPDRVRRRRLQGVVGLPLVVLALVVPFDATARWTRRLSATLWFSVSVEALVTTIAVTLCLVLPLSWVGARTLAGEGSSRAQADAYGYALVAYLFLWPLDDSFGGLSATVGITERGQTHVDWPVTILDPLVSVLLVVGLLVGIPASRWLARLDTGPRKRRPAARTAWPGNAPDASPPIPERRTLLGIARTAGPSVLGGVAVGPTLAVDYDLGQVPQIALDFEYRDGEVTVTHQGGDRLTEEHPGHLAVTVNGAAERRWRKPVAAGDSVTVEAAPDDTHRIVWKVDGERLWVMGAYVVPAA